MTLLKKILTGLTILFVVASVWGWMDFDNFLSSPMNIPDEGVTIEVKLGSNLTRVVAELTGNRIINKPHYLLWYARWQATADKIHTGEYHIIKNTTPKQFLEQLVDGKVIQYSLTIVEGWNFKQLIQEVIANPYLSHDLKGLNQDGVMTKLGYQHTHPEGRFLPDTYSFPKGMSDVAFLNRAYQAMQDYLKEKWPERDVGIPVKTPEEALILASIVEKETGLASERKEIAGVFGRRLVKRMRLQTDPTVIYGMGDKYKGNIRRKDLKADNPYNTYRIFGLPPTPIALPGRDAIDAVMHPADGNDLYFVSKGDGSHYFSATLKEHNEAVIKYQLKGRRRPFSSYKNN